MDNGERDEIDELRAEIHALRGLALKALIGLLTVGLTVGAGALVMVGSYKQKVDTMSENQAEMRRDLKELRSIFGFAHRRRRTGDDDEQD